MLPKLRDLWRSTTWGERLLILISFGFYVRTWIDIAYLDVVRAVVHMAANGVITLIIIWSMRRPKGTGF
jgi:hypothetical protein